MKFSLLTACIATLALSLSWVTQAQAAALDFTIANQPTQSATDATSKPANSVALSFTPTTQPKQPQPTTPVLNREPYSISDLFVGGVDSLIARTVGSAEGTRTADGGYTSAYFGHVDPGNGVWNLGSFSYQHGATSPEQADRKQLRRLQQQAVELRRQSKAKPLTLTLLEELNGIDLANQAPLAALDRGYIDWLHQAPATMPPAERIVWARTKSFLDPDTGYWDAPGLGNHWNAIYHDQQRRYDAINRALQN